MAAGKCMECDDKEDASNMSYYGESMNIYTYPWDFAIVQTFSTRK
jgi:hypothetical protein